MALRSDFIIVKFYDGLPLVVKEVPKRLTMLLGLGKSFYGASGSSLEKYPLAFLPNIGL